MNGCIIHQNPDGEKVRIPRGALVGQNVFIHPSAVIYGGEVVIGDDVIIRAGVRINTTADDGGDGHCPKIGKDVIIGAGAIIDGGAIIPQGSRIPPGTFVGSCQTWEPESGYKGGQKGKRDFRIVKND